ncbi:Hypothetical protein CINCED_3A003004 [Cinara cedri]|nr:Hypothetical protein CINCED_3A003004 [Cinara cedri]
MGASWERPLLGQGLFFGCPVSQCMLTINNSLAPQVDAVLFRHVYVPPSYKRPRNQIWIIEHTEPPFLTVPINDNGVFNWTANYRWDSDIPRPYGYFKKYEPEQPVPSIVKNYAEGKTKLVAWFVSNCQPFNKRNEYAAELSKHITVDIYGRCGTLTCSINDTRKCLNMLNKNYKFYLAFENSNCKYYITEKLFTTSLGRNLLPIVMGASRMEYELVAPNHSFIHVDDFKSAEDLAMYLHKLDKNDELYNEYFKWKDTGTIVIYNKLYCRICAMLHDKDHPPKHYTNLSKWWSGPDVCHP